MPDPARDTRMKLENDTIVWHLRAASGFDSMIEEVLGLITANPGLSIRAILGR